MTRWRLLGSLKLALAGMLALCAGILASYDNDNAPAWFLVLPLFILSANLLAAIAGNPRFRRQAGLLIFHLSLLAVFALVAVGRVTHLKARVEITEGQGFDPAALEVIRAGMWHPWHRLNRVAFEQGDFRVAYAPGLLRGDTFDRIWINDTAGNRLPVSVGDSRPLRAGGYRFYTTSNKGYAAIVTWMGSDARAQAGTVHFPSFPLWDWKQVNHWRTPAGTELTLELVLPRRPPEDRAWVLDSREAIGTLTVDAGAGPLRLISGAWLQLPEGRLRFDGLRMWMGYEIFYDPTLRWLLAVSLVGVFGLSWHFWQRLWSQPIVGASGVKNLGSGLDVVGV